MTKIGRSVDIPEPDLDRLREVSKQLGLSVSELAERIVIDYLEGRVQIPEPMPAPTIVRTSFMIEGEVLRRFIERLEQAPRHERVPSIIRAWLEQPKGQHD